MTKLSAFAAAAALATVGFAAPAASAELTVQVVPDTLVCAQAAQQCGGAGHVPGPAAAGNHNPIRLFVLVTRAGAQVTNLTIANFQFTNGLVPAGGGSAVVCPETVCGPNRFGGGGGGLYQIFIDRYAAGNWTAGTYAATLRASRGADRGTGLVTFEIKN